MENWRKFIKEQALDAPTSSEAPPTMTKGLYPGSAWRGERIVGLAMKEVEKVRAGKIQYYDVGRGRRNAIQLIEDLLEKNRMKFNKHIALLEKTLKKIKDDTPGPDGIFDDEADRSAEQRDYKDKITMIKSLEVSAETFYDKFIKPSIINTLRETKIVFSEIGDEEYAKYEPHFKKSAGYYDTTTGIIALHVEFLRYWKEPYTRNNFKDYIVPHEFQHAVSHAWELAWDKGLPSELNQLVFSGKASDLARSQLDKLTKIVSSSLGSEGDHDLNIPGDWESTPEEQRAFIVPVTWKFKQDLKKEDIERICMARYYQHLANANRDNDELFAKYTKRLDYYVRQAKKYFPEFIGPAVQKLFKYINCKDHQGSAEEINSLVKANIAKSSQLAE